MERLNEIGEEVQEWLFAKGWLTPVVTSRIPLAAMKVAEEAGEVNGAVVKWLEGRQSEELVADELADLVIAACSLSYRMGFNMAEIIEERWKEVRAR